MKNSLWVALLLVFAARPAVADSLHLKVPVPAEVSEESRAGQTLAQYRLDHELVDKAIQAIGPANSADAARVWNEVRALVRTVKPEVSISTGPKTAAVETMEKQAQEASAKMVLRYPGLGYAVLLTDKAWGAKKDVSAREVELLAVNGAQVHARSAPSLCFPRGKTFSSENAECRAELAATCNEVGADGDGMYRLDVDSEFRTRRLPVETLDDFHGKYFYAAKINEERSVPFLRLKLGFCKLVTMSDYPFEPKRLRPPQNPPSWVNDGFYLDVGDATEADFKEACVDKVPVPEVAARLIALKKYGYPFDVWGQNYENKRPRCIEGAAKYCKDTFVREKVVYGYPAKGCEVREVAAADLKKEPVDAKFLAHVQMCEGAAAVGYTWPHQRPKVSEGCK